MGLDYFRITYPETDFGGSIGKQTAIFEGAPSREGRFDFEGQVDSEFLLTSQFDAVNSAVQNIVKPEDDLREGVFLDVGGGDTTFTITMDMPVDNDTYQWGASANAADGPDRHTATGAGRQAQVATVTHVARVAAPDSTTPAQFAWGEWSSAGSLDPLPVAVRNVRWTINNQDPQNASVTFQLSSALDIDEATDALEQVSG